MSERGFRILWESTNRDRRWWMERHAEQMTLTRDLERQVRELNREVQILSNWLMSSWVTVHESKVADIDRILAKYLGTDND